MGRKKPQGQHPKEKFQIKQKSEHHSVSFDETPPKENNVIRRIWDYLPGANPIIAFGTIVLGVIGIGSLWITNVSLIQDQRAWIAPIRAELGSALIAGQEIRVNVFIENSGRQPAFNVNSVASGGITLPFSREEAMQQAINGPAPPAVDVCTGLMPQKGFPTIYPSTVQHGRVKIREKTRATPEILNGSQIFFIHGCIAYETMKEVHRSEYCFFLSPPINRDDKWEFNSCRGGNSAD